MATAQVVTAEERQLSVLPAVATAATSIPPASSRVVLSQDTRDSAPAPSSDTMAERL